MFISGNNNYCDYHDLLHWNYKTDSTELLWNRYSIWMSKLIYLMFSVQRGNSLPWKLQCRFPLTHVKVCLYFTVRVKEESLGFSTERKDWPHLFHFSNSLASLQRDPFKIGVSSVYWFPVWLEIKKHKDLYDSSGVVRW